MNTKLVYVLISNNEDLYLEMTFLSITSARMHNPDACIVLVTDQETLDTCTNGLRKEFLTKFDEVVVVDTTEFTNPVKKSRFLKTTLRQRIKGDFLYIDTDTVICDDLSAIDKTPGDIAMVRDMHHSKELLLYLFGEKFNQLGHDLDSSQFYNAGIVYVKDTTRAHRLYDLWHEKWLTAQADNINVDQPPLLKAIKETDIGVTELEGVWNCQLSGSFIPFLADARIIHFHTGSVSKMYHKLADEQILWDVKRSNCLSSHVQALLESPKTAFKADLMLVYGRAIPHTGSPLFHRLELYKDNAPLLYKMMDFFCNILLYIYGLGERLSLIHYK